MQQGLQGAARFRIRGRTEFATCITGEQAGDEMMLIREASDAQALGFRALGDAGPIDMRGDIGVADFCEWRFGHAMFRKRAERAGYAMRRIELVTREAVVDREHETFD